MQELRRRLLAASGAILFILTVGSVGFYYLGVHYLGEESWSLFDCVYMTFVTLTTVGFGEILPRFSEVEYARPWTLFLIVMGTGTFLYFVSTLTAIIIEGDLQKALKETRMHKAIDKLKGHIIVCGVGSTGRQVLEELFEYKIDAVAIDCDPERMAAFKETHPKTMCVVGDATDDDILVKANIETAGAIVTALGSDKDNLYVTISARQANPDMRIVARGSDLRVLEKLKKAGADTVVSPNYIGGLRMVSALLRPKVVRFLDEMRRDKSGTRIEEIDVGASSAFANHSLADINFRQSTDLLVLAVRVPGADGHTYNPKADFVLKAGMTLVVLGPISQVEELRKRAGSPTGIGS